MSSSLHFGSHIKSLPTNDRVGSLYSTTSTGPSAEAPDNAYDLVIPQYRNSSVAYDFQWPTEEEAQGLVDSIVGSVGKVQQLFEPRSFSDRLSAVYDMYPPSVDENDLWYVEVLLVFALGRLLQGYITPGSVLPGDSFFLEAINHLPGFCALRSAGTLAVEILELISFYLQCADRVDDAYIYVSID